MPVRRDHCGRGPVSAAEPVDPAIQLQPLDLRIVRGEEIPVDWMRWFSDERFVVIIRVAPFVCSIEALARSLGL